MLKTLSKYAGFATVAVEWLALFLYFLIQPKYFAGKYPISYFASLASTHLIFTYFYILAAAFYWIFFRYHIQKYYHVRVTFISISMLFFIALAIFPYQPRIAISTLIHNIFGWTSAIFLFIGIYSFANNAHDKYIYWNTNITLVISLVLLLAFLFAPKESTFIFFFEAGAWLIWQIWLLWLSYYTLKIKVPMSL